MELASLFESFMELYFEPYLKKRIQTWVEENLFQKL